jgi:hypothetical protein
MPEVRVRKYVTQVEEILHEGGPAASNPPKRGAIAAVIENPYAGDYVENIVGFMDDLKPLGLELAKRLIDAIGVPLSSIEGYGKGAIVGAAGELEHGALWHAPGGYAMRELLGGAKAIVPSTKKVGALGARIDIPVTHKDASYVRSHFDSFEFGVSDAPRRNEMVLILVMTTGARVHARVGGLAAKDIKVGDGQR